MLGLSWNDPLTYVIILLSASQLFFLIDRIARSKLVKKLKIGKWFNAEFSDDTYEPLPVEELEELKIRFDLNDISLIVYKTAQITSKQNRLETQIIQRQMDFAEQFLITMSHKILENFQQKIPIYAEDNPSKEKRKDYMHMQEILFNYVKEIMLIFKQSFLQNGFYNLERNSFENYIQEKTLYIKARTTQFFNASYPQEMIVPVKEINTILEAIDFKKFISDIFHKAKDIHIEQQEEIQKADEELKEYIEEIKQNAQGK